jgi:carbamoyltransferase
MTARHASCATGRSSRRPRRSASPGRSTIRDSRSTRCRYCLREGRVALGDLRYVAFYDKPLVKLERLLETYLSFAPSGIRSFVTAMPVWLKEKIFLKRLLQKELLALTDGGKASALPPLLFGEHHESHAASAFYPSPFTTAAVLCMDWGR